MSKTIPQKVQDAKHFMGMTSTPLIIRRNRRLFRTGKWEVRYFHPKRSWRPGRPISKTRWVYSHERLSKAMEYAEKWFPAGLVTVITSYDENGRTEFNWSQAIGSEKWRQVKEVQKNAGQ